MTLHWEPVYSRKALQMKRQVRAKKQKWTTKDILRELQRMGMKIGERSLYSQLKQWKLDGTLDQSMTSSPSPSPPSSPNHEATSFNTAQQDDAVHNHSHHQQPLPPSAIPPPADSPPQVKVEDDVAVPGPSKPSPDNTALLSPSQRQKTPDSTTVYQDWGDWPPQQTLDLAGTWRQPSSSPFSTIPRLTLDTATPFYTPTSNSISSLPTPAHTFYTPTEPSVYSYNHGYDADALPGPSSINDPMTPQPGYNDESHIINPDSPMPASHVNPAELSEMLETTQAQAGMFPDSGLPFKFTGGDPDASGLLHNLHESNASGKQKDTLQASPTAPSPFRESSPFYHNHGLGLTFETPSPEKLEQGWLYPNGSQFGSTYSLSVKPADGLQDRPNPQVQEPLPSSPVTDTQFDQYSDRLPLEVSLFDSTMEEFLLTEVDSWSSRQQS